MSLLYVIVVGCYFNTKDSQLGDLLYSKLSTVICYLQTMDVENEMKMKQFMKEKQLLENKHVSVCLYHHCDFV